MDIPLILTSPHSGNLYPQFYIDNLISPLKLCHSIEDMYVNEFIENFSEDNIEVHISKYSRAVIDLNRNLQEIDKRLIADDIKIDADETLKVKSGIGLIPVQTLKGKIIFREKFTKEQFFFLKEEVYLKWHDLLKKKIDNNLLAFGKVFVIDFHSMPSKYNDSLLPDFVLGNINGLSCDNNKLNFISDELKKLGYTVNENYPYSGGYITKKYFNKQKKVETLQVEINKRLYMNEDQFEKNLKFNKIKEDIAEIIKSFMNHLKTDLNIKIAAE